MNTPRAVAALALAGALIATSAGCTSYSSNCRNNVCTVTLSGTGAKTEVGTNDIAVALDRVVDGKANFSVAGERATCAQGDELTVAGFSVTCTEVGDNKLTIELS